MARLFILFKGMIMLHKWRCSLLVAVFFLGGFVSYSYAQTATNTPSSDVSKKVDTKKPLPVGVVAIVNGIAISEERLNRAIQQSRLGDTPAVRTTLKNQLIAKELFRQEAVKKGIYGKRPEVLQAMQEAKDSAETNLYLRDSIKPEPVTDEAVKDHFTKIVGSLGEKEYKFHVIEVATEQEAQTALQQLKQGTDFAELAKKISLAANKVQGGDMNWTSFKVPVVEGQTQNLPFALAQALVTLPAGAMSATPITVNNRSYILRMDQVRPTQVPDYDAIKNDLRTIMENQALEKAAVVFMTALVKSAQIEQ